MNGSPKIKPLGKLSTVAPLLRAGVGESVEIDLGIGGVVTK
jgi:hypothetical protein